MKKLASLAAVLALAAGLTVPSGASAHDLSCASARYIMGHPNAYCNQTSPNHIWLYFPWRTCQEHVWWSHTWDGLHVPGNGGHCPGWSHPT